MNNRLCIAGLLCTCFMLSSCLGGGGEGTAQGRLAACSAEGSIFEGEPLESWPEMFHEHVSNAVEAHEEAMNISTQQLRCTEEEYDDVVPPSDALAAIAMSLPAWESRMDELGEGDFASVLLEFLRVYECALNEYQLFLAPRTQDVLEEEREGEPVQRGDFNKRMLQDSNFIRNELEHAGRAVARTLVILSGYDRLQPLSADIECLKRSSLDVRNVLGLASEVSACMPRSWDARGSLFTPSSQ